MSIPPLLLAAAHWPAALAVLPYPVAQDQQPSIAARSHLATCRLRAHSFLQAQAEHNGLIENESYVRRGNQAYFRFLVRRGVNEAVLICDAHSGELRRTLYLWDGL